MQFNWKHKKILRKIKEYFKVVANLTNSSKVSVQQLIVWLYLQHFNFNTSIRLLGLLVICDRNQNCYLDFEPVNLKQ